MREQPQSATDHLQGTEPDAAVGDDLWRHAPRTVRSAAIGAARRKLLGRAIAALRPAAAEAGKEADRGDGEERSEAIER